MTVKERARTILNLQQYNEINKPAKVGKVSSITPPETSQQVLRMLIKKPHSKFRVPSRFDWVKKLIHLSYGYQTEILKIQQPFCYLTIRHGFVSSVHDDVWHVDGFSMQISHLPEQSYFWSNIYATQFVTKAINIPSNFNPLKHNLQYYLQEQVGDAPIQTMDTETMYCIDPYVIHRRVPNISGIQRTFVRISYTPIEIMDDTNTANPLIKVPKYGREGVKDFRDKLRRYINA